MYPPLTAKIAGYHFMYQDDPFVIDRPHGLANHLVLLVHSPMRLSIGDGPLMDYTGDTVVVLAKDTPRHYENVDGGVFINDFINFSTPNIADITAFGVQPDAVYPNIPAHYTRALKKIIFHISSEQQENQYHSSEIANLYLELFFHTLGQYLNSAPKYNTAHPLFQLIYPIRNRFINNFQNELDVNEAARGAGLSPYYFRRMYKEIFGKTPQADIISTRLEYACDLLTKTDDTIRSIAEQCGYHNEEHFMRQFKKNLGMSPSAYRREATVTEDTAAPPFSPCNGGTCIGRQEQ